ncbi:NADH-quinone oxidoreductase subunit D-related protein [Modicisalibacter luteus]|uniref:NADH-quinone oxidoreductase subunit D domain-containing protein n=1 Tax=Modicisalibacter luteus TaxID=453962 RepID=A0ABV7M4R6_9GAMM|nr:hypothetical protein [Halomonas lutea]GHB09715.1 hypothetical protein GCM10007159_34870 [Halomonas lutea]
MAVSWLRQLAARSCVPVYPVWGEHDEALLATLVLSTQIELVDSPRHASVLLVVGEIPATLRDGLKHVHDQLPSPFAVVWFRGAPLIALNAPIHVDEADRLVDTLIRTHRELMLGQRDSASRLLPDEPPNPWEGLGDDGHGGEGMMGGTPYGRPMAMNMQDDLRDGLTLDSLTFRLGPFYPALPSGLCAEITLQGDVIQSWETRHGALPQRLAPVFYAARERPVPIAELELARARYHLVQLYRGLHLAGLERIARHALSLARQLSTASRLDGLRRQLVRSGIFHLAAMDGGQLDTEMAARLGGPAARAAGLDADLRMDDASYQRLGFRPQCRTDGTVRARWEQRLAEIDQSLQLARQAEPDGLHTANTEAVETPRGPWSAKPPQDASALLDQLLPGLEWDEAMTLIASLDSREVAETSGRANI